MMNFCVVNPDGIIENVIVCEDEATAKEFGASCDYSFHMTIDDWNETIKSEIPKMFEQGVSSFKMYMTYPAMMTDTLMEG